MPAAQVNLLIEQGATFVQQLSWVSGTGEPVNLSGYSARMQIRASVRSPDVILELTTENGGISLGGVTGSVRLQISADQSATLPARGGVYDLELVQDGIVTRLIEGEVAVSPEVTR